MMQCKIRDGLKLVSKKKKAGADGLSTEMYFMFLPIYVAILRDLFDHWLAQGSIPGQVTNDIAKEGVHAYLGGIKRL